MGCTAGRTLLGRSHPTPGAAPLRPGAAFPAGGPGRSLRGRRRVAVRAPRASRPRARGSGRTAAACVPPVRLPRFLFGWPAHPSPARRRSARAPPASAPPPRGDRPPPRAGGARGRADGICKTCAAFVQKGDDAGGATSPRRSTSVAPASPPLYTSSSTLEWGGAARTRHKFSGVRRRPPQRTVWGPARAASSSSVPWEVVGRAPKSPRARKVTFGLRKSLLGSKSDFLPQKSLFAPEVTFSDFDLPKRSNFTSIIKGWRPWRARVRKRRILRNLAEN